MARIRTIKPEFWSHPIMGKLDDATKLLAVALLNFADDEGFFTCDPVLVRNFARPFDDESTTTRRSLDTLLKIGWIEVAHTEFYGSIGVIVNFQKHQRIDRGKPSNLRTYYESTNDRRSIDDESTLEQGTGNREQGTGNGTVQPPLSPPTIAGGAGSPEDKPKRVRRTKAAILGYYSQEVRDVINSLVDVWPKSDPLDGRVVGTSWPQTLERVHTILKAHCHEGVTGPDLLAIGLAYARSSRQRYKAAQFYFGSGRGDESAPWVADLKIYMHMKSQAVG